MVMFEKNRLFELAQMGLPNIPAPLVKVYPFLAVIYVLLGPLVTSAIVSIPLVIFLILFGSTQVDVHAMLGSSVGMTVLMLVGFTPIYILIWGWLRLFEHRPFWTIGMEREGLWRKYLRGALVGSLMISAAVGLPAIFGYIQVQEAVPGAGAAITGGVILLLGWVVQGAAEEVLFRGFLLQILGSRFGVIVGVLATSILFALLHIFNANLGLIAFLNLALFGVFTSFYAMREGSLWGVFAVHSFWNWVQGNLFGMEVSGIPVRLEALIDLQEVGPDWLTGGAFGPEGGIAVTLWLCGGIIVLWVLEHRNRSIS